MNNNDTHAVQQIWAVDKLQLREIFNLLRQR